MGVKIMGPPNGDEAVADAMPFSNGIVIVTRAVQAYEATRAQGTHRITEEDLDLSDNWIRPLAVRAASGHSRSSNPDKMLLGTSATGSRPRTGCQGVGPRRGLPPSPSPTPRSKYAESLCVLLPHGGSAAINCHQGHQDLVPNTPDPCPILVTMDTFQAGPCHEGIETCNCHQEAFLSGPLPVAVDPRKEHHDDDEDDADENDDDIDDDDHIPHTTRRHPHTGTRTYSTSLPGQHI